MLLQGSNSVVTRLSRPRTVLVLATLSMAYAGFRYVCAHTFLNCRRLTCNRFAESVIKAVKGEKGSCLPLSTFLVCQVVKPSRRPLAWISSPCPSNSA